MRMLLPIWLYPGCMMAVVMILMPLRGMQHVIHTLITFISRSTISNDALLSAVAYYGYGGPGYESDKGMYNMLQENVRPYAYVITHMALSWVYDGCSDDSDAFKGNAATADGIKNMVNLMDIDAYLPFHRNTDI